MRAPDGTSYPHTCSSSSSRVATRDGREARYDEQVELGGREVDELAVAAHTAAGRVDLDLADLGSTPSISASTRSERRRMAPTLATSSRALNGFVM